MTVFYEYEIGTTETTTNLESLSPPIHPPRSQYFPYSVQTNKWDAQIGAHGYPYVVWSFDILTEEMVNVLRSYVGSGHSATVYINTKLPPDADNTTEHWEKFSGVMLWPQDLMTKRNPRGRYLGVNFTFRRLVAVVCDDSLNFSLSCNSQYIPIF